jgi:hypothetical protein
MQMKNPNNSRCLAKSLGIGLPQIFEVSANVVEQQYMLLALDQTNSIKKTESTSF